MPDKKNQPSKEELMSDAIYALAKEMRFLGNGGASRTETGIGAIEGLAMKVYESNQNIADALGDVASAIRELAQAVADKEK